MSVDSNCIEYSEVASWTEYQMTLLNMCVLLSTEGKNMCRVCSVIISFGLLNIYDGGIMLGAVDMRVNYLLRNLQVGSSHKIGIIFGLKSIY